jgi:hypothetical protein
MNTHTPLGADGVESIRNEKKTIKVPLGAGNGAIAVGGVLAVLGGRKN